MICLLCFLVYKFHMWVNCKKMMGYFCKMTDIHFHVIFAIWFEFRRKIRTEYKMSAVTAFCCSSKRVYVKCVIKVAMCGQLYSCWCHSRKHYVFVPSNKRQQKVWFSDIRLYLFHLPWLWLPLKRDAAHRFTFSHLSLRFPLLYVLIFRSPKRNCSEVRHDKQTVSNKHG